MSAYVALLRGINVGGKNKLPMKDLAELLTEIGCHGVQTYIQSGNALFDAPTRVAKTVPTALSERIAARFKLTVPVVLRTSAELASVARSNPFLRAGGQTDLLHVMFLAEVPSPERVASLDPQRSAPDAFALRGRDLYLSLPNGAGNTKLTNAYFDSKLATVSTGRNWRTVLKLVELCG